MGSTTKWAGARPPPPALMTTTASEVIGVMICSREETPLLELGFEYSSCEGEEDIINWVNLVFFLNLFFNSYFLTGNCLWERVLFSLAFVVDDCDFVLKYMCIYVTIDHFKLLAINFLSLIFLKTEICSIFKTLERKHSRNKGRK